MLVLGSVTFKLTALFYLRLSIVVPGCIFFVSEISILTCVSLSCSNFALYLVMLIGWNVEIHYQCAEFGKYMLFFRQCEANHGFHSFVENMFYSFQVSQGQFCISQVIYQSKGNMFMLSLCLRGVCIMLQTLGDLSFLNWIVGGHVKLTCFQYDLGMCHDGYWQFYNFFVSAWWKFSFWNSWVWTLGI